MKKLLAYYKNLAFYKGFQSKSSIQNADLFNFKQISIFPHHFLPNAVLSVVYREVRFKEKTLATYKLPSKKK